MMASVFSSGKSIDSLVVTGILIWSVPTTYLQLLNLFLTAASDPTDESETVSGAVLSILVIWDAGAFAGVDGEGVATCNGTGSRVPARGICSGGRRVVTRRTTILNSWPLATDGGKSTVNSPAKFSPAAGGMGI